MLGMNWTRRLCKQKQRKSNRNRAMLGLERLESRLAPATLVSPTKLTYQDVDGDTVSVKFSKPILNDGNVNSVFFFDAGAVDGNNTVNQQLLAIVLPGIGAPAAGTTITTVATRSLVTGGDGFAALGLIDANNIDLGAVAVDGDLGRIFCGDHTLTTSGLKGLTAQSLGRYGPSTGGGSLGTYVYGKLGFVKVKGDVKDAEIYSYGGVNGRIGDVSIGGSLIGGSIRSDGDMGDVKIGGSVRGGIRAYSGLILSRNDMGFVTIAGSVTGADGLRSGAVYSEGKLAGVKIGGSVQGGIGLNSGLILANGDSGLITIQGNLTGAGGQGSGQVSAGKLAGVTIGGSVQGGSGNWSGFIACGGNIGSIVIGGDIIGGNAAGNAALTHSGMIRGMRVASLIVGGSLIAGTDTTTGSYTNNGAVRVENDLGTVLIKGSVVGNSTNPAIISARGKAVPTTTTDLAIGSLTVLGRVESALILAGVDGDGNAKNADAQIGPVTVGGDWIASSIAAGVMTGTDGLYGNGDDAKMAGATIKDDSLVISRIRSLIIGGQALGTIGGTDHFGIVAEKLGALIIGDTAFLLTLGNSNDDFLFGITGDFKINEI